MSERLKGRVWTARQRLMVEKLTVLEGQSPGARSELGLSIDTYKQRDDKNNRTTHELPKRGWSCMGVKPDVRRHGQVEWRLGMWIVN